MLLRPDDACELDAGLSLLSELVRFAVLPRIAGDSLAGMAQLQFLTVLDDSSVYQTYTTCSNVTQRQCECRTAPQNLMVAALSL
jgi:hypothetical protein